MPDRMRESETPMHTKQAPIWVRTRVDGWLGWWPARRTGRTVCEIRHAGRRFRLRPMPDDVRPAKPIGA